VFFGSGGGVGIRRYWRRRGGDLRPKPRCTNYLNPLAIWVKITFTRTVPSPFIVDAAVHRTHPCALRVNFSNEHSRTRGLSPDARPKVPAEGTPQFNSLLWLSESQELSSYSNDELRARYALATLIFTSSTIPPPLSEDSHCTWSGIACNGLLQVTAINATALDLTAFHFPPELALLSDSLTSVVYDGSQYEGSLPTELGRLAELTDLSLSSRGLNGTLPSELGMLSTLQVLHISRSSLTGTLPTQFGLLTNLRSLDLSQNDFSSVIPTEMGQLTPLMRLDISDNSLSGGFPNQLTRLSNLVVLNVGNNNLNQALLNNTFDTYTNLETLDLSQNGLAFSSFEYSGTQGFPSLRSNTALTYFDVSSNLFTATMPSTIQYLTNLVHLNMSKGKFTGELPAFLGLLTKLTSIDLSTNALKSWDSMIFNLSNLASLEFFDLTDNCVRAVLPCDFFPSSITANKTIHVDRDYVNCTGDCCAPAVYINRYLGGLPMCLL
jgi:Leucine-rich repeat (LRR) protein